MHSFHGNQIVRSHTGTKLLLSGFLSIKNLGHSDWLPCAFHTRRNTHSQINRTIQIGVIGASLSVNQELIIKVWIYFSVGSISVFKRLNHFK